MKKNLLVWSLACFAMTLHAQQPANITVSGCTSTRAVYNGNYTATTTSYGGCLCYDKDGGNEKISRESGFSNQWFGHPSFCGGGFSLTASGETDCNPTNGPAGQGGCTFTASPLPVELTSFTAQERDGAVRLTWLVQTEINNEGFDVLRSSDSREWHPLGFVEGRGSVSLEKEYGFTDATPLAGTNYYRLMQWDFDGQFEYSKVVSVEVSDTTRQPLSVYPNPSSGQAWLFFQGNHEGEALLTVYDLFGKALHRQRLQLETEQFNTALEVAHLPAGTYLVNLSSRWGQWQKRLVIQ